MSYPITVTHRRCDDCGASSPPGRGGDDVDARARAAGWTRVRRPWGNGRRCPDCRANGPRRLS